MSFAAAVGWARSDGRAPTGVGGKRTRTTGLCSSFCRTIWWNCPSWRRALALRRGLRSRRFTPMRNASGSLGAGSITFATANWETLGSLVASLLLHGPVLGLLALRPLLG